jgi:enolase-phosphatase E1
MIRGVLLDVEGTTSSLSFVRDVLYPFALQRLSSFLLRRWGDAALGRVRGQLAADPAAVAFTAWSADDTPEAARSKMAGEALRLMAADAKVTWMKELQGLIWAEGYAVGLLKSHVYPDVAPAMRRWADAGLDVRVFSSGSVTAQKAFFGHTVSGDLTRLLKGHYDTSTGPKSAPESYRRIAAAFPLPPGEVLFLSDKAEELDAAAAAGMRTGLMARPENPPPPDDTPHSRFASFDMVLVEETTQAQPAAPEAPT